MTPTESTMTDSVMPIDPIRAKQDYDEAMARIAQLMGSDSGTAQGNELSILAARVDAYEAKHFPIDAPDLLTAAQFRIEQLRRFAFAKPNNRRRIQQP